MKKIVGGILMSAMLFPAAVQAVDITAIRDIGNSKFMFNGTADAGTAITIDVFAPDKDIDDIFNQSYSQTDVVKYHNEFYADEDGKVEFNVGINGDSGIYKAYVSVGNEFKEFNLEFVKAGNTSIINSLNSATDIKSFIAEGTNRADLGFFLDLYDNVDQNKVATLIAAKLPVSSPEDAIKIFDEAVIIAALSEGDISGISAYADRLTILKDGGRYEKRYPSQVQGVDARLSGKVYNTVAEFEAALAEAVVLETIKNPNGYQNVHDVMNEFKTEIGISSLTDLSSVYQNMAGKSYDNFSAMKTAYEKYLTQATTPSNSYAGGGGGGSNSGTGSLKITGNEPTPLKKIYFNDMTGTEWAETAVNYLAEKGIILGKAEGQFCPADEVLREEFVTMVVKAFGFTKIVDINEFTDVSESDWYYEYVMAANQNGIINGIDTTTFGAGEKITRQDMATILYRIAASKNIELAKKNAPIIFKDDADISDYAKEAIYALQESRVINGMEDGLFLPGNPATRAQAAQMIYGLLMAK